MYYSQFSIIIGVMMASVSTNIGVVMVIMIVGIEAMRQIVVKQHVKASENSKYFF